MKFKLNKCIFLNILSLKALPLGGAFYYYRLVMKKFLNSHLPALATLLRRMHHKLMKYMPMEYVFTHNHKHGSWGCRESASGSGSTLAETAAIREALPVLFREYGIRSLLDVPCGDYNWMKEVAPSLDKYTGADVVRELVDDANRRYAGGSVRFVHLDALKDRLPEVDCILCRDMLVHFPFREILQTLRNFKSSRSRFLLTTTFPDTEVNKDISLANWRMINLERPPFNLPPPVFVVLEHCPSKPDKSLGLWRLSDFDIPLDR